MEFLRSGFLDYLEKAEHVISNMTLDIAHDYIFLGRHFPFFCVFHIVWICIAVRRHAPRFSPMKSFLTTGCMVFLGRIVTAFVLTRKPLLIDQPLYIVFFLVVWFLVNCSPWDFVHKIITWPPFIVVFQLVYTIIQVRGATHGVDMGLKAFNQCAVGGILTAVILSSSECFVWLLINEPPTREFSGCTFLRNLFIAVSYFCVTEYSEFFSDYIDTSRKSVKLYALTVCLVVCLLNQIFFGLWDRRGIDITFLSYVGKLFSYKGNR